MFTVSILAPKHIVSNTSSTLEIYDQATKLLVHTEQLHGSEQISISLNGNKYDNRLKYRFVTAEDETGNNAQEPYKPIAPGGIAKALKDLQPDSNGKFNLSVLDGVSPSEVTYLMRNVLMNGYHKILLADDQKMVERYERFLKSFDRNLVRTNSEIQYVHQILSVLIYYINRCNSRKTPLSELDENTVDRIIANYCRSNGLEPESWNLYPGLLVAKGHLINRTNRIVASNCYEDALQIGAEYLNTFLRIDALTTFFSDVPTGFEPNIISHQSNSPDDSNRTNICFSVDPKYFRMYAPLWAATSSFYKDIVFNYLIVTETEEEYLELAEQYRTLLSSSDSLADVSPRSNVRLFWFKNSESLGRTLFACARFYLAKKILDDYPGEVFVCDIDQFVIGDLSKFLTEKSRLDHDIQLAVVENYFALLPGRSHLAGYIYLKNTDASRKFSNDVTDYIANGLGVEYSWMLDQNAVRYASERTEVAHLDMRSQRVFGHYGTHKDALRARIK